MKRIVKMTMPLVAVAAVALATLGTALAKGLVAQSTSPISGRKANPSHPTIHKPQDGSDEGPGDWVLHLA